MIPYITLDEFLAYQKIKDPSDEEKILIQSFIDAAQTFIESPRGAGHTFAAEEEEVIIPASLTPILRLEDDLAEISSIKILHPYPVPEHLLVDGKTEEDFEIELLPVDYKTKPRKKGPFYEIELLNHPLMNQRIWAGKITITGYWAYSKEPDALIKLVMNRLTAHFYRQKDTQGQIDGPIALSHGMVFVPSAIPKDVASLLYSYRQKL